VSRVEKMSASEAKGVESGREVPDLSVAIPCYNEALSIRRTAEQLVDAFERGHARVELVLVDNGSQDETGAVIDGLIADGLPIRKVTVIENVGYGNGVLRGLEVCRGKYMGFTCADGQVDASDLVKLYEVLAHGGAPKLVKVRRRFRMDGVKRKIVSVAYNVLANLLFGGLRSIDLNGNPKLFPRTAYEQMRLESKDWFLDLEVMLEAKRIGLPVFEMNVMAQMRGDGTSNVRSTTIWEFIGNLMRWRFARGRHRAGAVKSRVGEARASVESSRR
jgi:polyisoprenyl-phosphate glycosyltransferase